MELRGAVPDDRDEILVLLRQAGLPIAGVAQHLADFLVVEHRGRLLACGGLEDYGVDVLLRSIAVAPGERNSGLGALLVLRLIQAAADKGAARMWLLTDMAAQWFPRFGFVPGSREQIPQRVHASAELQGACPEDANVLHLHLAGRDT